MYISAPELPMQEVSEKEVEDEVEEDRSNLQVSWEM